MMKVIRKLLAPEEISPADRRYNPDCNCIEVTPDGGTTWIEDPASDPRHSDVYRLPALTEPDAQCDAAARIVHLFQDHLTIFFNSIDAAVFATHVLGAFLLLSPFFGILANLALLAFEGLITIGTENIADAFTPEVWEGIQNIIYCHIGADGQMSIEQRDAIMSDISDAYPGTVYNTLVNVVNLFGEVLMSNAGVEYDDTGDCSEAECAWCFNDDWRDHVGLFTQPAPYAPAWAALWVDGSGWKGNNPGAYQEAGSIHATFDPTRFTGMFMSYIGTHCGGVGYDNFTMQLRFEGAVVGASGSDNTNDDNTVFWEGDVIADEITVFFNVHAECAGTFRLWEGQFAGFGDCPFGEPNC